MNRVEEINKEIEKLGKELPEVTTRTRRHEIMNQISKLTEEEILIERNGR